MTNRETRSATANRWFVLVAGVALLYIEVIWLDGRPIVIGAALTMIGFPGASWLDRVGFKRNGKEKDE